jgi:hypothetical protein
MDKKFHPVAGFQLEMITNRLRDRRLALAGDGRFHAAASITFCQM